ncbi:MAG: DegQ family serine endoprotease [Nitrospirota bacterium]
MKMTIKKLQSTILIIFVLVVSCAFVLSKESFGVSSETTQFLSTLGNALSEVAETARPAVVNISTTSTVTREENPFGGMFNDPFFRRFFGDQFDHRDQKQKFKKSALGSGVIVTEDGYILTNNHVVKEADEIKIVLNDKREFKGRVVGSDPKTDLAVVKIDAEKLPTVKMGDSGVLKTGDVVVAIGNPFGLSQTITMGIVSAVGRSNVGIADFEDFIQTDAAINPGNSGGALVNAKGELIGINTAIFSTSGGYMGIGFAIPSNMAKSIMDSIIKNGKVIRGWMGVSIQNLTNELAESLGIKDTSGALVSGVEKNSPADQAGIKRGDIITALHGKKIADSSALRNMVSSTTPGTKTDVTLIREGKEKKLAITLGESKEKSALGKSDYANVMKGVIVQELTQDVREKLNIPENIEGVIVTGMSQNSPARSQLRIHDVIQEISRHPVQNIKEYDQAVSKIKEKSSALLLIYRNKGSLYITIKP